MKIAQINPGHMTIPPDSWGAVEKIIWQYKLEGEKKNQDIRILYINDIHKNDFDIVHVHMWNHALELRDKQIPYIFTCHDHHAFIFGKDSDVYKKNLEAMIHADVAIVPAQYLVEYFNNVPIYLRHGIDPVQFYPGNPNKFPKLLVVGNNGMGGDFTFDRKGFRYAIEASEKLGLPITVVGPTDCNKNFFDHHRDLVNPNVTFRYDLSDKELQDVYREHDILIHASSVEAGHPPLTLLEAAASGLPIITTDCSGELYSIETKRNTDDVADKIKKTMQLYDLKRIKTLESVRNFYWSNIVDDLLSIYESTKNKDMKQSALYVYNKVKKNKMDNVIYANFVDGAFLEIKGNINRKYRVNFIDKKTGEIIHFSDLTNNTWSKTNRKWFTDWSIEVKAEDGSVKTIDFNINGKKVFIVFESSSLGDTLAWFPYVEEFRKHHNCQIVVSTFHNNLFQDQYPDIEFVNPGSSVDNVYALYRIGVFYNENGVDFNRHKTDFRKLRLQEYASDILGLEFEEIRPKIKNVEPMKSSRPYICIANHSTAQSKYWNNPTGWQELVDYVKSLGYDVYLLSREDDGYMGNKNPTGVIKVEGKTLEEICSILLGSLGFVGISSGLSWLSWSLGVNTVLISGQTDKLLEPSDGIYRVINENVCHGCFSRHLFDKSDWNWCPDHKGTERQFECSKEINFEMVKTSVNKILGI